MLETVYLEERLNMVARIPWPRDAVIIVCATPEEAKPEQMDSVNPGRCRDCRRPIVYDGYTMQRAERPEIRRGRPIEFLCVKCFPRYEFAEVTHFEDHRNHKAIDRKDGGKKR